MEDKINTNEKIAEPKKLYHKFFLLLLGLFLGGLVVLLITYVRIKPFPLANGRLNFLILGASGGSRVGPDLTDTLILGSINFSEKKLFLLSIPRDLWIKPLKIKINAAYHYGGFSLASSLVEEITDVHPAFTLLVDFNGFRKAVDLVGGIDIGIERTFDDFKYPIEDQEGKPVTEGPIYEHVHFDKGREHLDGQQALKYARSRYSEDPVEGTDMARSVRQQKVILALKKKLLSPEFFLRPSKIYQLIKIGREHLKTDLTRDQISSLLKLSPQFLLGLDKTTNLVLGQGDLNTGILVNPPVSKYGQWVLEPESGDWALIRSLVNKALE